MVRINLRGLLITSILLFTALSMVTFGKTIYVDDDAAGANDGSSWENAYVYLQDALVDANSSEKPIEVRVAQGIYKPDVGANQTPGDPEATFQLINGVTLKGGYAGFDTYDPNTREVDQYETILSGDLDMNDVDIQQYPELLVYEPTRKENSYNVVTGSSTDETAVLDGFTVSGGNATGDGFGGIGGGIYNDTGSPTLTNCKFTKNFADLGGGGGIYNLYSNPILKNCSFSLNCSSLASGGMYNNQSNPTLIDCSFINNDGFIYGGGMYNDFSNPTLIRCKFIGNWGCLGGGMYNINSNPTLTNCSFIKNMTSWCCIYAGVYPTSSGGGIYNDTNCNPILANCTFSGNEAAELGGGMYSDQSSSPILTNCILWNNLPDEINGPGIAKYSDIHGGWPGDGNIDVDPLFVQPGYWADVNDPNIVVEPIDPNAVLVVGDYHLKSEAGRWDPVSESWVVDDVTSPCIDAGDPNSPVGDEPEPNGGRINMGAYGGTVEASMSPGVEQIVYVQWLGHSTVKVWTEDCIVYVDPERVTESLHDATLVCVTHTHGDHYSPSDIAKVSNAETQFIAPPDVVSQYGSGQTIAPGQTIEYDFVTVKAVPAYNINKPNHPKSNNWVGYIIELGGKRIYIAGDTDLIEEMKSLSDIDVAFLPAGGTYTMNAIEAAEATGYIKPDLAIPYHWGQSVGTLSDAQRFAELAQCPAKVMTVGETISSDNWPEYSPLIAHWALDEAEGDIAHDNTDENHGVLYNEPIWQPAGGKIDGALQLDGIDDYISTDFVLDPSKGSFSVFAWIKSDSPGGVVISQADGAGSGEIWLGADPSLGRLMTGLVPPPAGRFVTQPIVSDSIVTDDQWHHIGFAWDGSYRSLYADGTEVIKDTAAQNPLKSADGGLNVGASKTLDVGTFFSGLIDDVRIYNLALSADEIAALTE